MFQAEFGLHARYRCPSGLAAFADRYRGIVSETPTTQSELRIVQVPKADAVLARVKHEIIAARRDGVKPGQIAVLSLQGPIQERSHRKEARGPG